MLSNGLRKHIQKLLQKKYRKEYQEYLVEGVKGVEEAIASEVDIIAIIVDGKRREESTIAATIEKGSEQHIPIEYAGRKDIDAIKTTVTFPGVMAIVSKRELGLTDLINNKPILCFDHLNDPGNLGTIIRSADWFDVPNILLSEKSVDPYHEKVVRSTMGSIFHTNIYRSANILVSLEKLVKKGYSITVLDIQGEPLPTYQPASKTVYILGSESHGIRGEMKKLAKQTLTIPGQGRAESLNVAMAASILLYQITV